VSYRTVSKIHKTQHANEPNSVTLKIEAARFSETSEQITRKKVKFTLQPAMKAQRGSRCITTLSLTSALDGGGWSTPRPGPLYPREREPVPIVQETGWTPGPVWTRAENLAPTGIRSPDRPVRRYTDCGTPPTQITPHGTKTRKTVRAVTARTVLCKSENTFHLYCLLLSWFLLLLGTVCLTPGLCPPTHGHRTRF
jgi:hypothetical protein